MSIEAAARLFNDEGTVRAAFERHAPAGEARFTRPMQVRLLQERADAP